MLKILLRRKVISKLIRQLGFILAAVTLFVGILGACNRTDVTRQQLNDTTTNVGVGQEYGGKGLGYGQTKKKVVLLNTALKNDYVSGPSNLPTYCARYPDKCYVTAVTNVTTTPWHSDAPSLQQYTTMNEFTLTFSDTTPDLLHASVFTDKFWYNAVSIMATGQMNTINKGLWSAKAASPHTYVLKYLR